MTPFPPPALGARPAGAPLVARDAYGSRFPVAAPSIAAVQSAADALGKQGAEELPGPVGTAPFRHRE